MKSSSVDSFLSFDYKFLRVTLYFAGYWNGSSFCLSAISKHCFCLFSWKAFPSLFLFIFFSFEGKSMSLSTPLRMFLCGGKTRWHNLILAFKKRNNSFPFCFIDRLADCVLVKELHKIKCQTERKADVIRSKTFTSCFVITYADQITTSKRFQIKKIYIYIYMCIYHLYSSLW